MGIKSIQLAGPKPPGKRTALRQPLDGFLDPRGEVWRRFLELNAFHDQVHVPFVDKVMYDLGNTWRIWHFSLLRMGEEKFLSFALGHKIPPGAIHHEVIRPNLYAGSIVGIL